MQQHFDFSDIELANLKLRETRLKVLEGELSKVYIELEGMFERVICNVSTSHAFCSRSLPFSLSKRVEKFIDDIWYKNYRFGLEARTDDRMMDAEMLKQRIAWLELSEKERIKILQKTIADCHKFIGEMVKELSYQVTKVPVLTNEISSLKAKIASLEMQGQKNVSGVSISFGNRIPPLSLNIAGDQLKSLYRALSVTFHPDKHPEDRQQYGEIMKAINVWNDEIKS